MVSFQTTRGVRPCLRGDTHPGIGMGLGLGWRKQPHHKVNLGGNGVSGRVPVQGGAHDEGFVKGPLFLEHGAKSVLGICHVRVLWPKETEFNGEAASVAISTLFELALHFQHTCFTQFRNTSSVCTTFPVCVRRNTPGN